MSGALKRHLIEQNKPVPQIKQADPQQVPNNAGGFTFEVSAKTRLERFLMLGTDGGTYYVNEKKLTEQNVDFLVNLIKTDPDLVLNTTVEVSHSGRAYRNSAALFVLALMFKHASVQYKAFGTLHIPFSQIARTSTHLFEMAGYFELLGGWSRSKRGAVANWYTSKTADELAYQVVKYRQRDGWTHRDMFRLAHPVGVDQNVSRFILGKYGPEHYSIDFFEGKPVRADFPEIIAGFKSVQDAAHVTEVVEDLSRFPNLPWEAIPTQFHKSPDVWRKLFENGQLKGQALLRQITRLARLGMFQDMVFARDYANRLVDGEMIAKTRLHPIQYLLALIGYTEGQIPRDSSSSGFGYYQLPRQRDWTPSPIIKDALNEGFYKAFQHVEPANKRTMIGLDVSGSMSSMAMGIDLTCAQVGAAMAMTVARTEPYYDIRGFSDTFKDLGISATMSLQEVLAKTERMTFSRTDCSLPMEHAIKNKLEIDTFVVITDNETYAGRRHPHVALQDYRQKSGIDAKLVVMGMTGTPFSIADPKDRGMLDVVGADTSVPRLIADFSAGRI